jgi:transcriptional regulator with XRE-family HTH domain
MIGGKIVIARKRKGLSQKALADIVGMDAGNLARIENGHIEPTPKNLLKLAEALEVPIDAWVHEGDAVVDRRAELKRKMRKALEMPADRQRTLELMLDELLDLTEIENSVVKRVKK